MFRFIIGFGTLVLLVMGVFAAQVQSQTPEAAAPDFFIKAEVENTNPYLGQQVTYIVSRYQAIDFPNPPHFEEHPFTGFWHTPLFSGLLTPPLLPGANIVFKRLTWLFSPL